MGKVIVNLPWGEMRGMVVDAGADALVITLESDDYPPRPIPICVVDKEMIMKILAAVS